MMSSTPMCKLFSSDIAQTEFVSDVYQGQHSNLSHIESNEVYIAVGSCYDDTHGDHSYTSSTYCEYNENDSDCIPSTSTDNTYSKPPLYLEMCVSCHRLLKRNCVLVFKTTDYNMWHEIVKKCIGNTSPCAAVKEFICRSCR